MASILYRDAQFKGWNVSKHSALTEFTNTDTISGYAKSPMAWAVENNLISSKGNILTRFDEMFSEK